MSARDLQPELIPSPGLTASMQTVAAAIVGDLIGFAENGTVPLVAYQGQVGTAAIRAISTIDLHGAHIGRQVVLVFNGGDPLKPIILGCVQRAEAWPLEDKPPQVEIDADGARLVVTAKEQIVLRCGKASITLTRAGKVLIQGSYLLSRSSGVNRIKGGSIQLN